MQERFHRNVFSICFLSAYSQQHAVTFTFSLPQADSVNRSLCLTPGDGPGDDCAVSCRILYCNVLYYAVLCCVVLFAENVLL
jgi:hypothetical protein